MWTRDEVVAVLQTVERRRTRVERHDAEPGRWEWVQGEPDPRLRAYVGEYHGYIEHAARPVGRWELPFAGVPVIVNLGAAYQLSTVRQPAVCTRHGSFLAGLDDVYALSKSSGAVFCLQMNFTPIGAYQFLGLPMSEIAHRVVDLGDVFGATARRLEERLFEASTWDARFAILDGFIAARIREARPASPRLAWAWHQLRQADGALEVGLLAAELGWSRKHLVARFRDQVGLPPKRVARILRFNRMVRLLDRANAPGWAEIAHECGYYDQSHLIRDVHYFARCTPTEFLQRRQDPEVVLVA